MLWQPVEPEQGKRAGDEQEHGGEAGESGRDLSLLGLEDQAGAQVLIDIEEAGFAVRFEIAGVRLVGDVFERLLVQPHTNGTSIEPENRTVRAAHANGIDADATLRSLFGYLQRGRAGVALAIAEQDDDRGGIGAARHGRR